jgi:hypothetical protein
MRWRRLDVRVVDMTHCPPCYLISYNSSVTLLCVEMVEMGGEETKYKKRRGGECDLRVVNMFCERKLNSDDQ